MIYALISSYKEGPLLRATVESAKRGCDVICVYEGPVGPDAEPDPDRGGLWHGYFGSSIAIAFGSWPSDADKRSRMLRWAKDHHARYAGRHEAEDEPLWILWLDGDETLLWGEYLADWCRRADAETGVGGFAMRIVELDGSVVKAHGRIFRGEVVSRFLESSYQVELESGMILALPNIPICSAGGIPMTPSDLFLRGPAALPPESEEVQKWLSESRPPLQGEPHILHRSILRDPARGIRRLHEDETAFYEATSQSRMQETLGT